MLVSGGYGDNSRVALSSLFLFLFSPQSLFHLSSSSFSKFLSPRWSHLLSSLIHSPCIPLLSLPLPLHPTDRLVPFCSLGSDAPHRTRCRGVERARRSSPFSPPTLSNLLTPVHPISTPISTRLALRAHHLSSLLSPSILSLHPSFHLPFHPSTSSPTRPVASAPLRPACQPLSAAPHLLPPRHHSHPPPSPRLRPSTLHPPRPSPSPHPVPEAAGSSGCISGPCSRPARPASCCSSSTTSPRSSPRPPLRTSSPPLVPVDSRS